MSQRFPKCMWVWSTNNRRADSSRLFSTNPLIVSAANSKQYVVFSSCLRLEIKSGEGPWKSNFYDDHLQQSTSHHGSLEVTQLNITVRTTVFQRYMLKWYGAPWFIHRSILNLRSLDISSASMDGQLFQDLGSQLYTQHHATGKWLTSI